MRSSFLLAASMTALALGAPLHAQDRLTTTGAEDAVSTIVTARTATTIPGLVNNLNQLAATDNFFSGLVRLDMRGANGAAFGSCSGSLISARHILTAAHCVAFTQPGGAVPPANPIWGTRQAATVDVRFRPGGAAADNPAGTQDLVLNASRIDIHSGYSGSVVHKNDIAIVTLDDDAPVWATRYELHRGNPFAQQVTFAGWGGVGDANSGDAFSFGNPGRRLAGVNRWEATRTTSGFNGIGTSITAALGSNFSEGVLMYDFDSGTGANNSMCNLFGGTGALSPEFQALLCDLGYGGNEVALGRGDSGGAGFINGRVAGVASWVTTGTCNPNVFGGSGVSCIGAFGGHADVSFAENYDWIRSIVAVPEPGSLLLLGVGLVGLAARARRRMVA